MKRLLFCIVVAILMASCGGSPFQQGQKLAVKYNTCMTDYNDALVQVGEDFAGKIKSKYDSRTKAMDDYLQLLRNCHQEYLEKWGKIYSDEQKMRKKLKTTTDMVEFETGLQTDRDFYTFASVPDLETVEISPAVIQQVRTIIPPKPVEAKIAKDLVGHTLSEGKEEGYYPQSWTWKILEGGVSDLKIVSTQENTDSRYTVVISMKLSSETRAYNATATVSYVLDDIHDWQIEYVRSMGMDIVKTHKYDDCMKCYLEKMSFSDSKYLYGENNCDIALEVAGKALCEYDNTWQKFYCVVSPHEKAQIYRYHAKDFIIDYIERP